MTLIDFFIEILKEEDIEHLTADPAFTFSLDDLKDVEK